MITLQTAESSFYNDFKHYYAQEYNEDLRSQSTEPVFCYDIEHDASQEYNECLKDCIFYYKNHYISLLHTVTDVNEAVKYMFFATLFQSIDINQSFDKNPSQYLDRLIKEWNTKTYGNEIIKKEFYNRIYIEFMKKAYQQ